jgi:hypothetical protein
MSDGHMRLQAKDGVTHIAPLTAKEALKNWS